MLIHVWALMIGMIAGLRAMTPLAVLSCTARMGWLPLQGTPLAFMGYALTPWILALCALGELVNDKLPKTPSRMIPMQFGTRLVTGACAGATLTAAHGLLWTGLVVGATGAAIGTWGGHRTRRALAKAFHNDVPAALLEDALAIAGAVLIVLAAA
ncbi:hypothetical protein ASG75_10855 [Rhodanobacter sp. Soil772]|uniref:DUF4126 family protein n=1 Tax=Rhodanobacter sp. Soil772 TaxID=1736406 RepID=UPI0006F48414|nr:DUF4126 family protein [Rhodanobacter sp. Soil772]KRE86025.1 hypothetical protein ASG75_10855 [Rhodanobacter sp. Soil772]